MSGKSLFKTIFSLGCVLYGLYNIAGPPLRGAPSYSVAFLLWIILMGIIYFYAIHRRAQK